MDGQIVHLPGRVVLSVDVSELVHLELLFPLGCRLNQLVFLLSVVTPGWIRVFGVLKVCLGLLVLLRLLLFVKEVGLLFLVIGGLSEH